MIHTSNKKDTYFKEDLIMALEVGKNAKKPEVKEEVKATAAAPVAEEAKEAAPAENIAYGTKRKALAFVCPLGDPSNQDTTKVTLPDGTSDRKITSTIVGYKFKCLEDLDIPNCGTNDGFKNDAMNYEVIDRYEHHKAGDIVCLTPFETALLLSSPEFNGGCEGGEKAVSCVYQKKALQGKGGVATVSATAQAPRVSLRATTGSIKDFAIEDVLTFTEETLPNGAKRKHRTIKSGFEKWAPLAKAATRKVSGGRKAETDPTKVANASAQAFMAFVNSRKK